MYIIHALEEHYYTMYRDAVQVCVNVILQDMYADMTCIQVIACL